MKNFVQARLNMVRSQLETNKVTDPAVLDAFSRIPREVFLPQALRDFAYIDEDIEVVSGRHVMEPMVLARLVQAGDIESGHGVLDVGGAGGYTAAVLSLLADRVVSLECNPRLAMRAKETLAAHGFDGVTVVEGPLETGYSRHGPYDVIILGGAVSDIPPSLTAQLAEGGCLLCVMRPAATGCGRAVRVERHQGKITPPRPLFDANVPLLPGFVRAEKIEF